MYKYLDIKDM